MPSSPKFFHARTSPPATPHTRSTLLIFAFLLTFAIVSFLFALSSFLSSGGSGYRCRNSDPRSVRVIWDKTGHGNNGLSAAGDDDGTKRHKIMGFVGIQTGFGSTGRRQSLRKTWMPSDRQGLQRLEEATGLAFRFVIGRTNDKSKMAELKKEVAEYDDFLLLDIEEEYSKLPYKTLAFFKAAYALFDSEFYVKADDDIYLRPGFCIYVLYEPLSFLLGKEYFLHAYGPIYALSADVVASLVALRNDSFRMFSNEDVTIGAWMLAMNVNHEDNRALCEPECTQSSVAVWDIPKCSGLCNPETKMLELHQIDACSKSPTLPSDDD
ncbi:putative beta-1,3-galactosyltransferase 14 [Gossypium australe]|uniref:Hexosyltransferase n=1 Tax=Gossypium australe TaxID=47621 RepID=A0A5B6U740_9ROSI|nr:putative beta-1,3-galactosyltransferase 14 [Gossypium australe]